MREPLVLVVSPLSHCIPVPPLIIARLRTFTQPTCLHNLLSSGCAHLRHLFMYHLLSPGCAHLRTCLHNLLSSGCAPMYHLLSPGCAHLCLCTCLRNPLLHNLLSSGCAHLRHLFMYHLLSPGCAHLRNPLVCTTYYRPVAHIYATCLCLSIIARLRPITQPSSHLSFISLWLRPITQPML